ncbi:hypothetical protein KCP71_20435 [Salmonella enterica subsp. enterica]|nr:hypothetical protein KCP71_20435 [Salmonella enterica subsp. enterica]
MRRTVGFAECAFEDAARYANQRIAFSKPIGHNQMIGKAGVNGHQNRNMRNMVLKVAGRPIGKGTAYQPRWLSCTAHAQRWK